MSANSDKILQAIVIFEISDISYITVISDLLFINEQ